MRSERVPFTTVETDFPNTVPVSEYTADTEKTAVGFEAYDCVPNASEQGAEYADDAVEDEGRPNDAEPTADTEVCTSSQEKCAEASDAVAEVVEASDAAGDAPRFGPDYNKLPEGYRFEGSSLICPGAESIPSVRRVTGIVRIDRELRDRVKVIADLERRKMTAVVEEAIRRFLADPVNEPRPYLPYAMLRNQTFRLTWFMPEMMDIELRGRAVSEGRDVMVLVRRAILDYVEESPYDPLHLMRGAESEEPPENPSRIDEGASDVSEYQNTDEARLNPSEPNQTGDKPSEEVVQ